MPRTCRDCGQTTGPKRRLCKPCTLEARETREATTPLQTDAGQNVGAWIRTGETWHASVAFDGYEHEFACLDTFTNFPAADVSIDHHALAHEHVCPDCRAAIDAESMPEPWKRAVADGGTVEDWHGTEAPASADGVDLLEADACPACESTGTFFEGPAGYFTCGRCHSTWAGDVGDAEIVTYLEWSEDKELVTDGGTDEEPTHYCEDCEEKLALLYDERPDESIPIVCGHCGGTNTRRLEDTEGSQ